MIRSEGQDPQHFTISRRTTNRRRRLLRIQTSPLSASSSLVKVEGGDYSSSDSSSSSSGDDLFQYQHKKRRVLQAYNNACNQSLGAQESTSDGGSSSGSVNGSSPTKILGPSEIQQQKQQQLKSSVGKKGTYSTPKKDMMSRTLSVPSPSNEVLVKTEPACYVSSTTHGSPHPPAPSTNVNILKPLNQNSILITVPSESGSPRTQPTSVITRTFPSAPLAPPTPSTPPIKSTSTSDPPTLGIHYPFYLLVEAAVHMRELEIRMQQAAQK